MLVKFQLTTFSASRDLQQASSLLRRGSDPLPLSLHLPLCLHLGGNLLPCLVALIEPAHMKLAMQRDASSHLLCSLFTCPVRLSCPSPLLRLPFLCCFICLSLYSPVCHATCCTLRSVAKLLRCARVTRARFISVLRAFSVARQLFCTLLRFLFTSLCPCCFFLPLALHCNSLWRLITINFNFNTYSSEPDAAHSSM